MVQACSHVFPMRRIEVLMGFQCFGIGSLVYRLDRRFLDRILVVFQIVQRNVLVLMNAVSRIDQMTRGGRTYLPCRVLSHTLCRSR